MKEFIYNQYKNLFLWSPFVMGFGAALYFSLNTEPYFQFPIVITILLSLILYFKHNIIIKTIALFCFGFFYSMSFTQILNTPQINNSIKNLPITGTITDIDFTNKSTKLYLSIPAEQLHINTNSPINIRVSINTNNSINIGDTITGNINVFHPTGKYVPYSFDFARWAYFNDLSGTGFLTNYTIQHTSTSPSIRTYIHNKSNSFLTDALVLGYKHTLTNTESQIWKTSGISHVWSISGFHMTLVSGWLFALFYLLFRCIPTITKRIPAKYPALICAWCGLLLYLCISGLNVATIRAFLMITLLFIASICNRNIFSLRNAVLAFFIIFLINPFYIMHAGFQLSFAAIFGLLWFFQTKSYTNNNFIYKLYNSVKTIIQTTFVAGLFTLPFIIAHFGYIPLYSIIGNVILLPIFSIIIMPLVMIGTLCSLFNYHLILHLANNIYLYTLHIAQHITNLPHANIYMPTISNTVFILSIFALLSLILIVKTNSKNWYVRNINYIICSIFFIISIVICINTDKPLFYASSDHNLVGFIYNNKLMFNKSKNSSNYFAFDSWKHFNYEYTNTKNNRIKCPKGLCVYNTPQWNLVYMQKITTVLNNINTICKNPSITYIVTPSTIYAPKCHAKILQNGLIIYKNGTIKEIINQRPWHIKL